MWVILQYSYFIVSTIICLTCLLHNRTVYMENVRDGHDLNRIEQDMFLYNQLQGHVTMHYMNIPVLTELITV